MGQSGLAAGHSGVRLGLRHEDFLRLTPTGTASNNITVIPAHGMLRFGGFFWSCMAETDAEAVAKGFAGALRMTGGVSLWWRWGE